jgi:hypothetical protein
MSLVKSPEMTDPNLAAHRSNARQSHGPVTPQGKSQSAASNLRHGFYSEDEAVVMLRLGEDPQEFGVLMASLHEDLDPRGRLECELVSRLGCTLWRMRSIGRTRQGLALKRVEAQTELEELALLPRATDAAEFVQPFLDLQNALDRRGGPTTEEVDLFIELRGGHGQRGMPEFVQLLRALTKATEQKERRRLIRRARTALRQVTEPHMSAAWCLTSRARRINSPENLAAMAAPHDERSMLLQVGKIPICVNCGGSLEP